jgi:hypothetical protein
MEILREQFGEIMEDMSMMKAVVEEEGKSSVSQNVVTQNILQGKQKAIGCLQDHNSFHDS